jgi:hypothetical protein
VDADRSKVMAYRILAQQLQRVDLPPAKLAVLDLGVQDTPYGAARQALAARTSKPVDDKNLRLVWSHRGAPHLQRTADLPALAAALWPVSDADAAARFVTTPVKAAAPLGIDAYRQAADAFRAVVGAPMPKGEVSTAVTARIDPKLSLDCKPCGTRHISGALFQLAGLPGGVGVRVDGSSTVIEPLPDRGTTPTEMAGLDTVIRAYLRLLGPATAAEVAKFVGTTQTHLKPYWPDDLAEVNVDGRTAYLPADAVDAFTAATVPDAVRLLPPSDPFLQARDRALIVPDKKHQGEVWKILGNPGAVLAGGEIAGTWRAKASGKKLLTITVTEFAPLPKKTRGALEAEADRLATVRGIGTAAVTFA